MASKMVTMTGFRAKQRTREMLELAAECADMNLSEFIRSAALAEAARVLAGRSQEDAERAGY